MPFPTVFLALPVEGKAVKQPGLTLLAELEETVHVPVSFCCYDNYHDQLLLRGRKALFGLHFQATGPSLQEARAGTEAGASNRNYGSTLLVGSFTGSHLASFLLQNNLPGDGALPTVAWVLLHQLAIKAIPHTHGHRAIGSDNSSVEVFL